MLVQLERDQSAGSQLDSLARIQNQQMRLALTIDLVPYNASRVTIMLLLSALCSQISSLAGYQLTCKITGYRSDRFTQSPLVCIIASNALAGLALAWSCLCHSGSSMPSSCIVSCMSMQLYAYVAGGKSGKKPPLGPSRPRPAGIRTKYLIIQSISSLLGCGLV